MWRDVASQRRALGVRFADTSSMNRGARVTGIDISPKSVALATERARHSRGHSARISKPAKAG